MSECEDYADPDRSPRWLVPLAVLALAAGIAATELLIFACYVVAVIDN